ncbi:OmpA family protein [Neolewinella persica]|uniref:OmpA family protein n=1 Tax=Neolewinella persica TaxID=70998 RepID=UPI00036087C8|nr:OmpA family protein [Neolewinella persica]
MDRCSATLLLILFFCTCGRAQSFTAFTGDLLKLPEKTIRYGFPDRPVSADSIVGQISFPQLNFLPRNTEENFPGVGLVDRFAFLLNSQLSIDTAGCYEFSLASDDGSRLWINDSLSIDNDRPHQWRVERDTQALQPGTYPVRVWYYNAYQPLMGLALKARYLGEVNTCGPTEISLSANALFAFGQSDIRREAFNRLDSLAAQLNLLSGSVVTITGHTDDLGNEQYNEKLSLLRAEKVRQYLVVKLTGKAKLTLQFKVVGAGEDQPAFDNATAEGRAANRRVVILVESQ